MSALERGAAELLRVQERRWLDDARARLRPARRRTGGRRPAPAPTSVPTTSQSKKEQR